MNCIICNGKINEDDDDFLEAGIDCYVCWLDVYRAKIAELEADLAAEKQRNMEYQNKCLVATGVDIPACGMTLIDAIEVIKRGEVEG